MSRDNARLIDAMLREFPLRERIIALVVNLIRDKQGPMSPIISMTACISTMAKHLREEERIALAELLRDAADHCEHRREVMPVD